MTRGSSGPCCLLGTHFNSALVAMSSPRRAATTIACRLLRSQYVDELSAAKIQRTGKFIGLT